MPLMKLKKLESDLQDVEDFQQPKIFLEQYATQPHIAACMAHTIEQHYGDLEGKCVADLGSGCGMLSVAAGILGAGSVSGFDIDPDVVETYKQNSLDFDLMHTDVVLLDARLIPHITALRARFDTVVMNPPFGTKNNRGIDINFLKAAMHMCEGSIYSLHKSSTRDHVLRVARTAGLSAQVIAELRYDLPASYRHHQRASLDIQVDFYRFENNI